MKSKKSLYLLTLSMELSLPIIAWLVIFIVEKKKWFEIISISPVYLQLLTGAGVGIILAFGLNYLVRINYFKPVQELLGSLFKMFDINLVDMVIIALLAGFCEEILFRVVLQQYWGIWITSFVFILIHGYFNPKSLSISVFGVIMFLLSAVIGYLYQYMGFWAAVSMHAVYDVLALYLFKKHIFMGIKSVDNI
ncbi:MAG TPA: CPBP family intramembrane metalloprotease [Candidatus Goldiibacteriota bacterium]|mgnify:CR=1 FL=1|jgi:membrane protease YdiL (CAAX protease family)|nr:CPBP family intramembrane metalloprotease [Candidatus Goldiibacteriota bacterium]HRQ44837.1 CPBP family intramembrane metalloprotease [Candidatus Goldiibacteriota bacterium]